MSCSPTRRWERAIDSSRTIRQLRKGGAAAVLPGSADDLARGEIEQRAARDSLARAASGGAVVSASPAQAAPGTPAGTTPCVAAAKAGRSPRSAPCWSEAAVGARAPAADRRGAAMRDAIRGEQRPSEAIICNRMQSYASYAISAPAADRTGAAMRDAIRGNQRQSAQLLEERLPMRDAIRGDQRTRGAPSNEGRNQRRSAHLLEERLQIIGEDSECHTQGGLGLL